VLEAEVAVYRAMIAHKMPGKQTSLSRPS
jgi:hypothetical protein